MRPPPRFNPGPLDRASVEALNQLARDFYAAYGRLDPNPPMRGTWDQNGIHVAVDTPSLFRQVNDVVNFNSAVTVNNTTFKLINSSLTLDSLSGLILSDLQLAEAQATLNTSQTNFALPAQIGWLNVNATANININSIVASSEGQLLGIVNRNSGGNTLTLTHEDAGSTAANRFQLPQAANVVLNQNEGILLYYSGPTVGSSRWYALDVKAGAAAAFSGARVFHNTGQSRNGNTAIVFNSSRYDTDSYHSNVTNTSRLTAPTTDKYEIGGQVVANSGDVTTYCYLEIILNGATVLVEGNPAITKVAGANTPANVTAVTQYALTAGDYVELFWEMDNLAAITLPSSGNYTPEFWIHRLRS